MDRINQLGMFLFLAPAFIMYIFFALLPLLLVRFRQRWRGLLLAFAAMPMLLGFWVTFAITVGLWLVTTTYTENQSNQLFDETSKTFWHLGFDYLFLIGIVLILAISYVRHQVRSRRATAGIGSDRFPRPFCREY